MDNTKNLPKALPRGINRACSGIVESVSVPPYSDYVEQACMTVGANYALDKASECQRQKLALAIKLNLIDRKEYPYSLLQRRFDLPLGIRAFLAEKRKFIHTLATLCGFLPPQTAT